MRERELDRFTLLDLERLSPRDERLTAWDLRLEWLRDDRFTAFRDDPLRLRELGVYLRVPDRGFLIVWLRERGR